MSTCLYLLLDTCWSKEYKLYLCAVLPVLFTLCSASSPTLSTVASYDLQDCHNTVMTTASLMLSEPFKSWVPKIPHATPNIPGAAYGGLHPAHP
eukprot:1158329-Pelagomonas_calceolata.AAC.17